MKSLFVSVAFALVVPLAACTSNNSAPSASVQSPTTQSSPAPETTTASVTKDWYNYTAKDGSYSIKFPGQPHEEDNSANSRVGKLKFLQVSYEDKANSRFYMTQSIKYPIDPSQYNVETGLDNARNGYAKGSESSVTSEKKITFKGLPGREVTYQRKNGDMSISRIFIDPKGPTLYLTIVAAQDGNVAFPEAQAFLDSLAIPQ